MDDESFQRGRRAMLGLMLMAALMIAGGLGLMAWDDRRDGDGSASLSVP